MLTQSITPAVKSYMEVQVSFFTDLTKKLFSTAQKIGELNLQLVQDLIEEMTTVNRQWMSVQNPTEFASFTATQLSPITEKLRNYQQRLSNLLVNANVELTKTAESHMPEASRTAAAVADELVRAASEETEKATQRQRAVIEKMSESARHGMDGLSQNQNRTQNQAQTQGSGQHA